MWTREHWPEEWALTQNNVAAALHRLGEREHDTRHLSEALAAYGPTPEHRLTFRSVLPRREARA